MTQQRIAHPNTDDLPAMEAADTWLTYLYSGHADELGKRAFQQWLHSSVQNQQAFENAQQLWNDLGFALVELDIETAHSTETPSDNVAAQTKQKPWSQWIMAAAATLVIGLTVMFSVTIEQHTETTARYATATAETETVTLDDGSKVTLAADSVLTLHFTDEQRDLTLEQGRAYFEVAPDKQRPFVVSAKNTSATAVGTAFDVNSTVAGVAVAVTHGIVDVATHAAPQQLPMQKQQLTAGQRISANRKGQLSKRQAFEQQAALAWRQGRLVYEGESLAVITEEINRYRQQKIRIDSPTLKQKRITLSIPTSQTDLLIGAIQASDSVTVARTPTEVVIRRSQ